MVTPKVFCTVLDGILKFISVCIKCNWSLNTESVKILKLLLFSKFQAVEKVLKGMCDMVMPNIR